MLSPPGDTIQETIDTIGMTQDEFAEKMGMPLETINELIKGKIVITPLIAVRLENVLGIPIIFWLNRERDYRDTLSNIEQHESFEKNKIKYL